MEIIIYVGDVGDNVRIQAQTLDSNAQLINHKNFKNINPGTYYLSLGDLHSVAEFVEALSQADKIIYVEENIWSDTKNNFSQMKCWTEYYMCYFNDKKHVVFSNFNVDQNMLNLADVRASPNKQLWIAGCSISHGVGVDKSNRYGQLVANRLELPVSFLTEGASSIEWAVDQILRSDLRSGDILIFGITGHNRLPYYNDDKIHHIGISYYKTHPEFSSIISIDRLTESNMIYRAITKINQVVNFCKKINVKLYLGGLLVAPEFAPYLVSLPNYTQFAGFPDVEDGKMFLDLGTDNRHPGPITHQWYADIFLDRILND